ncbi:hypothetical protein PS639_04414 [Pseudomonas fluorescens]|nr:hypothetical protein PS639_04414 [Pseudomonas fluorescens]
MTDTKNDPITMELIAVAERYEAAEAAKGG